MKGQEDVLTPASVFPQRHREGQRAGGPEPFLHVDSSSLAHTHTACLHQVAALDLAVLTCEDLIKSLANAVKYGSMSDRREEETLVRSLCTVNGEGAERRSQQFIEDRLNLSECASVRA